MIKFLTSNFKNYHTVAGSKVANIIDNTNGIVDQVKKYLRSNKTILFIPSSSKDKEKIKLLSDILFKSLELSGIVFENYLILDDDNKNLASKLVSQADLIFLSGGDTYIQNQFFKEIKLQELLKNYTGLIIGQSAGALNMASDVFDSPISMENSFPIHFKGLGLTDINIEPHFVLDTTNFDENENYQRKVVLKESFKRKIYGQCDGSHILITDQEILICGKTYLIENSVIKKIANDGEKVLLKR